MSVTDLSGDLAHELPTELAGNIVLDYGDRALMVQCGSAAEVLAWTAALRSEPIAGVVDVVPAARTVLVKLDGPVARASSGGGCTRCASPPRHRPRPSAAPTW